MKHKQPGKPIARVNPKRRWEGGDPNKPKRLRYREEVAVTEGLVLYALAQLKGKKDKQGVPLTTSYGIWKFIKEEFGTERFTAGALRHALHGLQEKGLVIAHTGTEKSEAQSTDTFYKISEHVKPENLVSLLQQAAEHWEREKELSGKG